MQPPSPMPHSQAQQRWQAGQHAAQQGRWAAAATEYTHATVLAPHDPLYWMSLATARMAQAQAHAAQTAAEQALALRPAQPLARRVLAQALAQQNRHADALAVLSALPADVAPDNDYLMDLGNALLHTERWTEAVSVYLQVLQRDMHNALAHQRLGVVFQRLNRPRDAALCFETAAATDKSGSVRPLALAQLVQQLRQSAQWTQLGQHTEALLASLGALNENSQTSAFALLCTPATPAQQRQAGRLCSGPALRERPAAAPPRPDGRLRIGYLSADFCDHATSQLIAGLLEARDTRHFHITLYSHSPQDGSALQQRVHAACEQLRDVRTLDDAALARQMREDGIDIAIDLMGHTRGSRLRALAHRPAPLQLGYLGYPGSTGADYLDYIVGDPVVTPLSHADDFSECIAQMPHSYQPNDAGRGLGPRPARAALGLPEDAVVLCCFNQTYKITPEIADLWADILRQAPQTVLWLLVWNDEGAANLARELQQRGVAPERLFFSPKVSADENLARLQCADLFLDTWPYNGHTTASEALWAGVPVLTVPGRTFASRVGAGLVSACGLSHLVCASAQDYVRRAVGLAQDRPALRAVQQHLAQRRQRLHLFDTQAYARDFEALLLRIWARHAQGLPPAVLPARG